MITWILGIVLIIFVLIKRFGKDGRVEGFPLGMPRGSINNIGKNLFSIIVFIAVTSALLLFTFKIDFTLIINVSLRRTLLLLINIYYGFRD